jgi:hypothetical protein
MAYAIDVSERRIAAKHLLYAICINLCLRTEHRYICHRRRKHGGISVRTAGSTLTSRCGRWTGKISCPIPTGEMPPQCHTNDTPNGIASFHRPRLILVLKYRSGTSSGKDEYMDAADTGELTPPQSNVDAAQGDHQRLPSTGEMRPRKKAQDDRPSFQQLRLMVVLKYGLGTCSAGVENMDVTDTVKPAST